MSKNSRQTFRSKFEEDVFNKVLERDPKSIYEPFRIKFTVPEHFRNYTPDIVLSNGICIECKGWFPLKDRQKMIFVRSSNPHLDIRLIFMNHNVKIGKTSSTTYGMWATKNDFIWDGASIPSSWVNEAKQKQNKTYEDVDHRLYIGSRYGPYSHWRER